MYVQKDTRARQDIPTRCCAQQAGWLWAAVPCCPSRRVPDCGWAGGCGWGLAVASQHPDLQPSSLWGVHSEPRVGPLCIPLFQQILDCPFREISKRHFRVVAGMATLSQLGEQAQVRYITKIQIHSDYNTTTLDNDVALLQLDSPWNFTDFVHPICIPRTEYEEASLNFSHCFISGWGSTYYGGPGVDSLQEAEVEMIDRQTCNQIHWYNKRITENMLCAGHESGAADSCQGDSGGPLQCYSEEEARFYLLGVTSFGYNCATPFKPGVYVRTSRYWQWIDTEQHRSASPQSSSSSALILLSVGLLLHQFSL